MTDQQHEHSIADMGLLMRSAYARYELTRCRSAKVQADGYRVAMERLISQRSERQVQCMEVARGLAA